MKKRLFCLILAVLMLASSFTFVSCQSKPDEGTYTRMTVDINPSVEFMVDDENKVVSVTALNDDGSILIVGEAFVGKTPEEAVELVVSLAAETGYLVKGNVEVTENTVKISVSGDTKYAEKLQKKIEKTVTGALEDLDINGKVEKAEAMKLDELRALASSSTLFTEEEIAKMDESQLYKAVAASRMETAQLLTEDMRAAYIRAKEYEISFAESEATAKIINDLGGMYSLVYAQYKVALDAYSAAIKKIDDFRYDSLVSPDSEYQKSLAALRDAKAEFLKQRTYVASLNVNGTEYASASVTLQATEEQYNRLLTAYEELGNTLNTSLEALVATLRACEEVLREIENQLPEDIKTILSEKAVEIEASVNEAKNAFFTEFENAHKDDLDAAYAQLVAQKNKLKEEATAK